jgi:DNA repair protein RecO
MEQKRDLAIVLRTVPYEERHRVVTALTERHGRISALARNAVQSRRFGGALDPFCASEWMFVERTGADLYRVEEAQVRRPFEGLRADFQALALASVFNELMLKLAPEREPCPELFRVHSNALAALEEMPKPLPLAATLGLLNGYLAKVMQWSGSQPQLSQCLGCQKSVQELPPHAPVTCIVADAGWVCTDCRSADTRHVRDRGAQSFGTASLRVAPAAMRDFHAALGMPIRQVPESLQASDGEHRALFAFLEALLAYHVPGFEPGSFKSLRFLEL